MKSRFFSILLLINFIVPWFSFSSGWAATVIDIMLVYDTTATTWVADNGGMVTFSEDAVFKMNLAMVNSDVDLEFNLVHTMSIPYTTLAEDSSTSLSDDLYELQGGDGDFAAVHAARDTYGADLVAMLIDHGSAYGYVGVGYLLTHINPGSPHLAFTVNAIQSVDISHTLTHEVGHNLGAHHSKYQASSPGPNWPLGGYSAGWYFTGSDPINPKDYHTIMAYNNDGTQSYTSAPLFSTPLLLHQGTVAGDPVDGDNARVLGETMATVADYRPSCVSIAPLSDNYEISGGMKTVTITTLEQVCSWAVEEALDWVSVDILDGTGNETITVTVEPNEGSIRSGSVTIAGQSYSIIQASDNNIFIFLPAILNAAGAAQ
jgi:metallopeptidase family M12-like protein/all-beta uncharacterized protein